MTETTRLLLTGHSGYIGRNVLDKILCQSKWTHIYGLSKRKKFAVGDSRFEHISVDLSKISTENLTERLRLIKPDVVLHFAGNPSVACNSEDVLKVNTLGTYKLVEAVKDSKPLICLASSCSIYGRFYGELFDSFNELTLPNPISLYGCSKLAAEHIILRSAEYGCTPLVVRLVAQIGKYATHGVVYDLCKKILSAAPKYSTVKVLGNKPGSVKPFAYVGDTARCILQLIDKKNNNRRLNSIYNLGPSDCISVQDILSFLTTKLNCNKEIEWTDENFAGDVNHFTISDRNIGVFGFTFPSSLKALEKGYEEVSQQVVEEFRSETEGRYKRGYANK